MMTKELKNAIIAVLDDIIKLKDIIISMPASESNDNQPIDIPTVSEDAEPQQDIRIEV